MLINTLCEYANTLTKATPEGWQEQPISYRIVLNKDGDMVAIKDVRVERVEILKNGKEVKKLKPETTILPERIQSSAITSNIIEHRPVYIFGLNYENEKYNPNDKTDKARKSQEAFMKKNLAFFKDIKSPVCEAFCKFVQKWEPQYQTENPILVEFGKNYKTSVYFGFCLESGECLEQDSLFKEAYDKVYKESINKKNDNPGEKSMCSVYGEMLEIARTHDKIKFPGGLSSGCVLIGMNADAFESYGKTQSYNAYISEKAMKQYTAALNYLLSDRNHHKTIDDLVIVYFAMKKDGSSDANECKAFTSLFDEVVDVSAKDNAKKANNDIDDVMENATAGLPGNVTEYDIDEDVEFYIVGMTPNSSRICVKFFERNRFGTIIDNLRKYQEDLKVKRTSNNIPFYRIRNELIPPNSNVAKAPSSLMSAVTTSAFKGTPYPSALLAVIIKRIKLDKDGANDHFTKLNDIRVGIIKAYLNRNRKENIGMIWDENNLNPAYICGSLFSVYEELQKKAATTKLNRTIKDSYYSSACSCPNVIMPKLEKLSQHHSRKLRDDPIGGYLTRMQRSLISKLNGKFPSTLTLDEQGQFIIGYYQMNEYLYMPKEEKERIKNNNEGTEV